MSRIQQLSQCLVSKYGLSEQEAESFVTTLFEIIREKLLADKIVKVKGLGTFKLSEMNARESVDVNTGERITIEGRYKLSFTPENAVRDRINSPFASFESIDMDDDVDFSEIDKKYEAETSQPETAVATEETPEVTEEAPQPEVPEMETPAEEPVQETQPEPVVEPAEEPVVEPAEEPVVEPAEEPVAETTEEPIVEATEEVVEEVAAETVEEMPVAEPTPAEPAVAPKETPEVIEPSLNEELIREDMNHNKTIITLLRWVLGVVVLILICIGAHFGYNIWHDNGMKQNAQPEAQVAKPATPKKEAPKAVVPPASAKDTVNVAKEADKKESAEDSIAKISEIYNNKNARVRTGAYNIIGTKEIVTVRQGQTLQSISKATLGEDMTCYIEVYNDGVTSVKPGDKIKIPQLKLKKKRKKK